MRLEKRLPPYMRRPVCTWVRATPEEIALSVISQMVALRRGGGDASSLPLPDDRLNGRELPLRTPSFVNARRDVAP